MNDRAPIPRYNRTAAALHWIIAALVVAQIYVGFTFGDRGDARGDWFDWHKTLGFAILLLSLARLGWRFAAPPPPLPATMPGWQRAAARISHALFYLVLIGLPMSGWAYISTGSGAANSATTSLAFGLAWPFLPGLPRAGHDAFEAIHVALVWTTLALLALHVAAAIKHNFLDRDESAGRMPPFPPR